MWYNNHNHTEVGLQNGNEFGDQIADNIPLFDDQIANEVNAHFVTPFRVVSFLEIHNRRSLSRVGLPEKGR